MTAQNTQESERARANTLLKLFAELAFVMLPLLVLVIVILGKGGWDRIVKSPEWSFAACVLYGETIVKLVVGFVGDDAKNTRTKVGFAVTLVIVLGLVPSVVLLSKLLGGEPTASECVAQGVFFCLSVICFFAVGGAGENRSSLREER